MQEPSTNRTRCRGGEVLDCRNYSMFAPSMKALHPRGPQIKSNQANCACVSIHHILTACEIHFDTLASQDRDRESVSKCYNVVEIPLHATRPQHQPTVSCPNAASILVPPQQAGGKGAPLTCALSIDLAALHPFTARLYGEGWEAKRRHLDLSVFALRKLLSKLF